MLKQNPLAKCLWDRFLTERPQADDWHTYFYTFFVHTSVENQVAFPGGVPVVEWPRNSNGAIPYEISFDLMAQGFGQKFLSGFNFAIPNDLGLSGFQTFRREEWPPQVCQTQATPGEIKAGFEDRGEVHLGDEMYLDGNQKEIGKKQPWPESRQFFLPAEKRIGNAITPLCVICGKVFIDEECSINLWSSDKAVRFNMRWFVEGKPSPSENWITADFAARKIAHSIFIDRPEGDFQ